MKNSEQIKEETEKLRLEIENNNIERRNLLKKEITFYMVENLVLKIGKSIGNTDIDTAKLAKETISDIELLLDECLTDSITMTNILTKGVIEKRKKQNG